jgi:prephenate dehydratase
MMKDPLRTYQTRLTLDSVTQEALQAYGELFAHIEHSLLADISKGKTPSEPRP